MRASSFSRSRSSRSLAALAFAFGVAGCGGQEPTRLPTAPTPSATATSVTPPAPLMDTSAVAVPDNLVAFARLIKPAATARVLESWTHLPMPTAEALAELVTGEPVGGIVDLEQSLDFALSLSGKGLEVKPLWAVSIAVKDVELAKTAFGGGMKLTPTKDGSFRIEPDAKPKDKDKDKDKDTEDDDDDRRPTRHCELGPAYGGAAWRIVCGETTASLDALSPYLRRTLTRSSQTADLHVEQRNAPFKAMFGEQKAMAHRALAGIFARGSGGGLDASLAVAKDLVSFAFDLDGVALDMSLADAGGDLSLTAKFATASSLVTRILVAHPERTDVPPAALWQVPKDAHTAYFFRGIDAQSFDGPRDGALAELGKMLENEGFPAATRTALVSSLKKLLSNAPFVYASGLDVQQAKDKLAKEEATRNGDPKAAVDARRDAGEAMLGWRVFGIEEPAARFVAGAKDLAAVWAQVAKPTKPAPPMFPGMGAPPPPPTLKIVALPRGMTGMKDALHLELDLYQRHAIGPPPPPPPPPMPGHRPAPAPPTPPPPPAKAVRMHILVFADGNRTWIVFAGDEATLQAKANAVLAASPDTGKLASRADLQPLHDGRVGSGGFTTARGLLFTPLSGMAVDGEFYGLARTFDKLAGNDLGAQPVFFSFTAQPGADPAPFVATLKVPRDAIQDAIRVAGAIRF